MLFPIGDLARSREDVAEASAETWHEARALFVKLAVDAYLKVRLEDDWPGFG